MKTPILLLTVFLVSCAGDSTTRPTRAQHERQIDLDKIDVIVHVQANGISAMSETGRLEAYTQRGESEWRLITLDGQAVESVSADWQPTLDLMWDKVQAVEAWLDDPTLEEPARVRSSSEFVGGRRDDFGDEDPQPSLYMPRSKEEAEAERAKQDGGP